MNSANFDKEHAGKDFIRKIVSDDVKNNKNNGRVHTRFPPESINPLVKNRPKKLKTQEKRIVNELNP